MSMGINSNITSIIPQKVNDNSEVQNNSLSSLDRLSNGLKINKAVDDNTGIKIADSLKTQSNSLGQDIRNSNDAIGIVQIADKAMDEQIRILDTIKVKATQAAQDGQTVDTRKALQSDIVKLMKGFDDIAGTTSYNGISLLNGNNNMSTFQIGNQNVDISTSSTASNQIGQTRFETYDISGSGDVTANINGTKIEGKLGTGLGDGLGALAENINKQSNTTGVRASYSVELTGSKAIQAGDIKGLSINGINIGDIDKIQAKGSEGELVGAINAVKDQTGVEASVDQQGRLNLTSNDGRAINIQGEGLLDMIGVESDTTQNGRLTLTKMGNEDIAFSITADNKFSTASSTTVAQATLNLSDITKGFDQNAAKAIGASANSVLDEDMKGGIDTVVTTKEGAMAAMDIADSAMRQIDTQRADLGSVQNNLSSTINTISVTQVNVSESESKIRDVDYASNQENFSKLQILAQSGSYAMSQANASPQNVLKLLQ